MKVGYIETRGSDQQQIHLSRPAFLTGTAAIGAGSALVTILTFFLVDLPRSWFIEHPKVQQELELKRRAAQLDLLQRSLQLEDSTHRAESLRLLIGVGLLNDPNGQLTQLAEDPTLIPRWVPATLPTSLSESADQGTGQPGQKLPKQ